MLDALLAPCPPAVRLGDPTLLASLEHASAALARLDQALDGHPLLPAFLYRTRLEAVRRQAAVDGHGIDQWHLAALLEGLRLRMDGALRIIDRGTIFDAGRTALGHHQWLTAPDFDQEAEVRAAAIHMISGAGPTPLLTATLRFRSWLDAGGTRPPIRAALVRHWLGSGLLVTPVPITGPRSLSAEAPEDPTEWACAFLDAVAAEAADYHQLLGDLERDWAAARRGAAGRRSTLRAPLAIDVLAAAPLISATTLARAIGMSIKGGDRVAQDGSDLARTAEDIRLRHVVEVHGSELDQDDRVAAPPQTSNVARVGLVSGARREAECSGECEGSGDHARPLTSLPG